MSSIPAPSEPDDCDEYEKRVASMSVGQVMSELLYVSYATNRDQHPDTLPRSWAEIYPNAAELEARYQAERMLRKVMHG